METYLDMLQIVSELISCHKGLLIRDPEHHLEKKRFHKIALVNEYQDAVTQKLQLMSIYGLTHIVGAISNKYGTYSGRNM
jgi:hypothetical protein